MNLISLALINYKNIHIKKKTFMRLTIYMISEGVLCFNSAIVLGSVISRFSPLKNELREKYRYGQMNRN